MIFVLKCALFGVAYAVLDMYRRDKIQIRLASYVVASTIIGIAWTIQEYV